MTKPHQEDQIDSFFITEDVAAELTAAGQEFEQRDHVRTESICDLFGWQAGETLPETVSRLLEKAGTRSGRKPRGEGV